MKNKTVNPHTYIHMKESVFINRNCILEFHAKADKTYDTDIKLRLYCCSSYKVIKLISRRYGPPDDKVDKRTEFGFS